MSLSKDPESSMNPIPEFEEGGRKKRKLNVEKYDVLDAFFRTYLRIDPHSMIEKSDLYTIYCKKIAPSWRIARNAMYRHMWSFYRDCSISAVQNNYRDFIKGNLREDHYLILNEISKK